MDNPPTQATSRELGVAAIACSLVCVLPDLAWLLRLITSHCWPSPLIPPWLGGYSIGDGIDLATAVVGALSEAGRAPPTRRCRWMRPSWPSAITSSCCFWNMGISLRGAAAADRLASCPSSSLSMYWPGWCRRVRTDTSRCSFRPAGHERRHRDECRRGHLFLRQASNLLTRQTISQTTRLMASSTPSACCTCCVRRHGSPIGPGSYVRAADTVPERCPH